MLEEPGHVVFPAVEISGSNSRFSAMKADEQLTAGKFYVLIPVCRVRSKVSESEFEEHQVSVINLRNLRLNGTLSPSLVNLPSLLEIHLGGNNLHGTVPANLTLLRSLRWLDLSGNNFDPPLPKFRDGVKVTTDDNPKMVAIRPKGSHPQTDGRPPPPFPINSPSPSMDSPPNSPSPSLDSPPNSPSLAGDQSPLSDYSPSPSGDSAMAKPQTPKDPN
ncbi:receptor-like kinase TMK3 [Abeliophyllum distichum]|uniref:Receptor-like kinase TMK3 n=1 Tax=Abeliophyllum distichum TaxID=126358 RepID=A0ABD1QYA0_9LAMI